MTLIHWNIFYTIGGAINIVVSMVYVAHINVVLALIIILMTPASVYAARIYSNKAKRYQKLLKEKSGKVSSLLYEIVRGIREIKLLSAQNVVTEQYMKQNKEAVRQTVTVNIISTKSERVNAAISLMAQMVLFVVSSMLINRSKLTIGGFVSCVGYFTTCVNCLSNINDRIQSVASNIASIDRVIEVYETEREDEEDFRPSIQVENGDILFSNVKFAYRKSNEVLTNVSLHIMAGKKIALVGKSGSGKSTLAALLLRFYDPTEGEIYIDGKNIREFNLMSLRRQVGYVLQESVMFDGSIRYNITMGEEIYAETEICDALEKAHILSDVLRLPQGLDTVLGEGGQELSGGQKQRIALARVFIRNPKIIIFDEATSALDKETEEAIKNAWENMKYGKTIIIIAHRISTIESADIVAMLDGGRIVGYDSHENLIRNCPQYSALVCAHNVQDRGVYEKS